MKICENELEQSWSSVPADINWTPEFVPGRITPVKNFVPSTLLACALTLGNPSFCSGELFSEDVCERFTYEDENRPLIPGTLCGVQGFLDGTPVEGIPIKILAHFKSLLADAKVPSGWINEGIHAPSLECYREAEALLASVYAEHGLLPSKILVTRGSAVYIVYRNPTIGMTLRIEMDNDLDAVASVSDGNGAIEAGAFESEFSDRAIAILQGQVLPAATVASRSPKKA